MKIGTIQHHLETADKTTVLVCIGGRLLKTGKHADGLIRVSEDTSKIQTAKLSFLDIFHWLNDMVLKLKYYQH